MEFTINRMKHCLAVATKMKQAVLKDPQRYNCLPDDAFILGMLHDVGYEFSTYQKDHAHKGGIALKKQGYIYWKEVYYHGIPQNEYDSNLLWLLNYIDMITGPTGESMTVHERIEDIAMRYGEDSAQINNAMKLQKYLKEKHF